MSIISISEKVKFIESVFGSGKLARNCKNFDVRCPICAPTDHSKKKLAIRIEDDRNHCWTCGWKAHTLAPLIKKYGSHDKFLDYCNRFMKDAERYKKRYEQEKQEEPKKVELPKDFKLLTLASKSDPDVLAANLYLIKRNLTERDLWYYKIGVSNEHRWHRRVIVPSFDTEGNVNYFVARAVDKYRKPKYDNPDFDKTPIIFNEINVDWSSRLVICEGVFDMFKCGDNVVPLLGSDLNEQSALFNSILVNNTPVALALDGNMWETKMLKSAKKLVDYNIDVVLVDTRQFEDPGSMTKLEFQDALKNAKLFDWRMSFFTKLDKASRTSLSHR